MNFLTFEVGFDLFYGTDEVTQAIESLDANASFIDSSVTVFGAGISAFNKKLDNAAELAQDLYDGYRKSQKKANIALNESVTKGTPPANLSPPGAGRTGAFKEAKRQSGIPTSQQPSKVGPNLDKRGKVQPGKSYGFEVPAEGGGTKTVTIRDDADGHDYGLGNSQNRGPHFNNEAGDHFDY